MQPWRFILVRAIEVRKAVHDIFLKANQAALGAYDANRARKYASLKLEGILEAPKTFVSSATRRVNADIDLAAIQCRKLRFIRGLRSPESLDAARAKALAWDGSVFSTRKRSKPSCTFRRT